MHPFIKIKTTKKFGRGLYATKRIKKGTLVEVSPVIVINSVERMRLYKTILATYIFDWGDYKQKDRKAAVVLGLGGLFNHSNKPNTAYICKLNSKTVEFRVTRDILVNEQLFIDYGYIPKYDRTILNYLKKMK